MHILLLNINPVVSRLISLCVRKDDIVLEEVSNISDATRNSYDLTFIDDASYVEEVQNLLPNLRLGKKIFLSSKSTEDLFVGVFDMVIKKPFLPSQITEVIESVKVAESIAEESEEEEEENFIFPLSTESEPEEVQEEVMEEEPIEDLGDELEEQEVQREEFEEEEEEELEEEAEFPDLAFPTPSSVLDSNELDKIKALLEESEEEPVIDMDEEIDLETRKIKVITEQLASDGLDIVKEDEIVEILSNLESKEKAKKEKSKKVKKKKAKKEANYSFEEALIAAIEGMKPRKIKKLLKDAEITIKINFKDGTHE